MMLCGYGFRSSDSQSENRGSSPLGRVRQAVLASDSDFTLAGIQAACPSVSAQMIKKVLAEMKAEGVVRLDGRARVT